MLIATGTLTRQSLAGKVIVVTGAGRGIGFEAVRALRRVPQSRGLAPQA